MLAFNTLFSLCISEATSTYCPNAYKCATSRHCIPLHQVCDGHAHCINGDDELLCNFVCPDNCSCYGLAVICSTGTFNQSYIAQFPKQTRSLLFSSNVEIGSSLSENVLDFPFLYLLNISRLRLEDIPAYSFVKLINLRVLDMSHNLIRTLTKEIFAGLQRLSTLILDGNNDISRIEPFSFTYLISIRQLRITGTKLTRLASNTFAGLNLESLDIRNNDIKEIEEFGLGNLAVGDINFQGNDILTFHKGIFTGVSSLRSLKTPAYKFCCVRPNYVLENNCFPHKDEFSSCADLMRISALQTMLWLIGLCALLGNILSIIYRLIFDSVRLKLGYGIFVTNLAVADFLMGVYLIIIAVADAVFRKR